jgi:hypothetical protein
MQFPTLPEGLFLLRGPDLESVIEQLSKKGGDRFFPGRRVHNPAEFGRHLR